MLEIWNDFLSNRPLIAALCGWFVAQMLKAVIYAIVNRKFEASRLVGDGGFPSCHSAMVTALATSCYITYGIASPYFTISAVFALIVMHDAMGVRLETGRQAKIINDIIELFDKAGSDLTDEEKLKELVGHTPIQVIAGSILGLLVAVFLR